MDITTETINRIMQLARPETVEIEGRKYATSGLTAIPEPTPTVLGVATLTGLVEYIKSDFDDLESQSRIIHVESHESVKVISSLFGPFEQRKCYLAAKNINATNFRFGNYYDAEAFIVALQSQFGDTEDRVTLLKILGNVKEENVAQYGDDGVTQSVTAKKGIALAQNIPIPNPVVLKPFRTFLEIEQPESAFVLRVRTGPECSLHEAEGGQWKLTAIAAIREYLKMELPGITIIA